MDLQGKKILIGITAGIAAYKIHLLVREFVKNGAEVKVIMTSDAQHFVTPLSLSTLSKNPVLTDLYDANGSWNNHVELALWADVMVIAPCTANTMAKAANGISDNLLLTTYFSAKCPVFIAPAMDLDMYQHPTTKVNLEKLESFGNKIIPAEVGELASGLTGEGRMAEVETIYRTIQAFFAKRADSSLCGRKILITAGPTYENIDPVRFIGNHSTGKMGFALAEEAAQLGMEVVLISGPTFLKLENPQINLQRVVNTKEMMERVFEVYHSVDVAIMSAAVADYTVKDVAPQKLKKDDENLQLELVKNPDILRKMGEEKHNQFLVGFALETENEDVNAKAKLERKNLDMIVLNSLRNKGAGFGGDTNQVKIFCKDGSSQSFDLKSKTQVAKDIFEMIGSKIDLNNTEL